MNINLAKQLMPYIVGLHLCHCSPFTAADSVVPRWGLKTFNPFC